MRAYDKHKHCNNGLVPVIKSEGFVFDLFTVQTKLRTEDYIIGGVYEIMDSRTSLSLPKGAWGLSYHRTIHTDYAEQGMERL